eukprot:819951-Rhodomonas_salina.1
MDCQERVCVRDTWTEQSQQHRADVADSKSIAAALNASHERLDARKRSVLDPVRSNAQRTAGSVRTGEARAASHSLNCSRGELKDNLLSSS